MRKSIAAPFTRLGLWLAVAFPLCYFGAQLAAAPFFPGYSFLQQDASTLGSAQAIYPWIFNGGALITGLIGLCASGVYFIALRRLGRSIRVSGGVALWILATALSAIWAAAFPLPDPRHAANPMTAALLTLPVVLTVAFWSTGSWRLRIYLLCNLLILIGAIAIVSGAVQIDTAGYAGLVQRITAATVFIPIAIVALTYSPQAVTGTRL